MADPLSIIGSAVGVISLGLDICHELLRFYQSWKNYETTISTMYAQLEDLTKTFNLLETSIRDRNLDPDIVARVEESIDACQEGIKDLEQELQKIKSTPNPENFREKLRAHTKRVSYPFKESTLMKIHETISELRDDVSLALNTLQIDVSATSLHLIEDIHSQVDLLVNESGSTLSGLQKVDDEIEVLNARITSEYLEKRHQEAFSWLSAPDPFSNHNSACNGCEPSTGQWFTSGYELQQWKNMSKSLLWLHGIPGCGKTVLTSTIITVLIKHCSALSKSALAYFYFDFKDYDKQNVRSFLCSIVAQLSIENPGILLSLHDQCRKGSQRKATTEELRKALDQLLRDSRQFYLVFDALDECTEKENLMRLLTHIWNSNHSNLHILVASRREGYIQDALEPLVSFKVGIQSHVVNQDIRVFIHSRIESNPRLRSWCTIPAVKAEIEDALVNGADGMFRWAVCQLDELEKCLTIATLRKALGSLPKTLYETYDRILMNIDEVYQEQAVQVLRWLAFSKRPLSIEEVAEAIAVLPPGPERSPEFDPLNRLSNPHDIFQLCPGLVTSTTNLRRCDEYERHRLWDTDLSHGLAFCYDLDDTAKEELSLAHFSVKEYLISNHVDVGLPTPFKNLGAHPDIHMAETCVAYLISVGKAGLLTYENHVNFPLALYAARFWLGHARLTTETSISSNLDMLIIRLLEFNDILASTLRLPSSLIDFDSHHGRYRGGMWYSELGSGSALHWSLLYRLPRITIQLLNTGMDIDILDTRSNTILHWALMAPNVHSSENQAFIRLLIQKGINVNAKNHMNTSALHVAAFKCLVKVLQLLLERGADINAQSSHYGNIIQAATRGGSSSVLDVILKSRISPKTSPGNLETPLYTAIYCRQPWLARPLLISGVDPNEMSQNGSAAIHAAAEWGNEEIVALLLEKGAEIDLLNDSHESALYIAVSGGDISLAHFLLNHGANVDSIMRKSHKVPLCAAIGRRSTALVKLLLEHGANINAQEKRNGNIINKGTAMHQATSIGDEELVSVLVDAGADVNLCCGRTGTPFDIATRAFNERIMWQLLEAGADVNTQNGRSGMPLQVAAYLGSQRIVKKLLSKGVDVAGDELLMMAQGKLSQALQLLHTKFGPRDFWLRESDGHSSVARMLQDHCEKNLKVDEH